MTSCTGISEILSKEVALDINGIWGFPALDYHKYNILV